MMYGRAADIPAGGACVFQLPPDTRCGAMARSLVNCVMSTLAFSGDQIDDARLAVSELAAAVVGPRVPPELWFWARRPPRPELVVSLFDASRTQAPAGDPAPEIVTSLASATGSRLTRSRLTCTAVLGRAVWFTFLAPGPWPRAGLTPADAARRLALVLRSRGVHAACHGDVIMAEGVQIQAEPGAFCWRDADGYDRRPLADLHETAEAIVALLEEGPSVPTAASPREGDVCATRQAGL